MTRQRNALKAGIFIVLTLVFIMAIAVSIRGLSGLVDRMQIRAVTFRLEDDLAGLNVGDDVRIGGFKVGDVRSIEIVPVTDARVGGGPGTRPAGEDQAVILVRFALPARYELREGVRIGIQTTVTEQTCINIARLGTGDVLAADRPLPGQPGALAVVMARLSEMAPMIQESIAEVRNTTIPEVNGILRDVHQRTVPSVNSAVTAYERTADSATDLLLSIRLAVRPVVDKYYGVGNSAIGMMDEIKAVFGDSRADVRGTMANLNQATGAVRDRLPGILHQLDGVLGDVRIAVREATVAIDDLKGTLANTRHMTGQADSLITANKSRLDGMIRSLNLTSRNLELASAEIRTRPWRLLYTPRKGEADNLALFDAAREFAKGAAELNDAAQALRDASKDPATDAARIGQLNGALQKSFEKFQQAETRLWDSVGK